MHHLRSLLPEERRVFIEPRVFASSDFKKRWYPDLVICNSKEVIAVVEMKYRPRGSANWEGDLRKLNRIAERKGELFVSNTRYLGPPVDDRQYTFASKTLFGWLGIHRPFPAESYPQIPVLSTGHVFLTNRFVQFHALSVRNMLQSLCGDSDEEPAFPSHRLTRRSRQPSLCQLTRCEPRGCSSLRTVAQTSQAMRLGISSA